MEKGGWYWWAGRAGERGAGWAGRKALLDRGSKVVSALAVQPCSRRALLLENPAISGACTHLHTLEYR